MSLNDPTDPMLHEFSLDARHMTRSAINAIRTALGISGAVGLILGIVLLFWPEKTIAVLAVFLGIYFLVAGVLRLGVGIFSRGMRGGSRALNIILGVLLIFVGILALKNVTTAAMSLSSPSSPSAVCSLIRFSYTGFAASALRWAPVSATGAMPFTVMPSGPHSRARLLVIAR